MEIFRRVSFALGVFAAGTCFGAVFHENLQKLSHSLISLLTLRKKKRSVRTLVVGLDSSGKTTLLYQMKLSDIVTVIPTLGFNVERIDSDCAVYEMWDVGGQNAIRPLWRHYFQGVQALIYVIDSTERSRFEEAVSEFDKLLLEDQLKEAWILIFANKQVRFEVPYSLVLSCNLKQVHSYGQDIAGALSAIEISEALESLPALKHRQWRVQAASAFSRAGLIEGLRFLDGMCH
jgi:small GTP-binding protein